MEKISLLNVQARWGYSELTDSPASKHYDGLSDLQYKRSKQLPFCELSEEERYELAFHNACIRPNLLVYLTGVVAFNLLSIDLGALSRIIVPPNVWYPESANRFVSFEEYIQTTSTNPNDARCVTLLDNNYKLPTDPITIGRSFRHPILIDGYHRAARFWKYAPRNESILAYVPGEITDLFDIR